MLKIFLVVALLVASSISSLVFATTEDDMETAVGNGDIVLAVNIAKPLAEKGYAPAQYFAGTVYIYGYEKDGAKIEKNSELGYRYYEMFANNINAAPEQLSGVYKSLGIRYLPTDGDKGMHYLWKSAHLGNAQMQGALAVLACKKVAPERAAECQTEAKQRIIRCPDICN
jgi:hypothetical protein